jgi:RHS repeat-associated protein
VAVTDADGVVVERLAYDPYGVVRSATAGQTEYASFTGHEHDLVTGLIPFGARDYDPHAGRWTSTDPAWQTVDTTAFNKLIDARGVYAYAGNDPVNLVDEDGQFVHVLVGAIVGAAVSVTVAVAKMHYAQRGPGAPKLSGWEKIGRIAAAATIGAGLGALTGGVSAVGMAVSGAADIAVERSKYRFRAGLQDKPVSTTLRAIQIGAHVVGLAASATIPVGLAAAGIQATPAAVKSALGIVAGSLHIAAEGSGGIAAGIGQGIASAKILKKGVLHKKHNKARMDKRNGQRANLVKQKSGRASVSK